MDKSLKKLSRNELIELLVNLSDEYEEVIAENDRLKQAIAAERQQRVPRTAKVGSIAQAALEVNGYFEAVQRSADDYLREIKYLRDELAKRLEAQRAQQGQANEQANQADQAEFQQARAQAGQITSQAQQQAADTLAAAQQRGREVLAEANRRAEATLAQANKQANAIVAQASQQANAIVAQARDTAGSARARAQEPQPAMSPAETEEIYRARGRHARG